MMKVPPIGLPSLRYFVESCTIACAASICACCARRMGTIEVARDGSAVARAERADDSWAAEEGREVGVADLVVVEAEGRRKSWVMAAGWVGVG